RAWHRRVFGISAASWGLPSALLRCRGLDVERLHLIISQRFLRIEGPNGVVGQGGAQRAPLTGWDFERGEPGGPVRQPARRLRDDAAVRRQQVSKLIRRQ